jgi:tRNA (guanine-N7-)-methyltransferase
MLKLIDAEEITNLRLFSDDAVKLLARLPEASLSRIDLLYPDPWPKTRHHKRRFVSPQSLALVARALKPGAEFRVATDIEDYANWTLAHVLSSPDLAWQSVPPGSWNAPFPGWEPTRYEEKARREGRLKSFYFTFRKAG